MPAYTSPAGHTQAQTGLTPAVTPAATAATGFVDGFAQGPTGLPQRCLSLAAVEQLFGPPLPHSPTGLAIRQFFANGGREAWVLRVATSPGNTGPVDAATLIGRGADASGLHALAALGGLNLLCLPRAAELPQAEAAAVYGAACRVMADLGGMVLIDPPADVASVAALQAWLAQHAALRCADAALYFPQVLVADPAAGSAGRLTRRTSAGPTVRRVGASGAIAGLFARTDAQRGVWRAPAGSEATLRGTLGLATALADSDLQPLTALGVNALRHRPPQAPMCWGARTLAGAATSASDWRFVPVRRLGLHLRQSLAQGLAWAVFEPNGEALWARLHQQAANFLDGLFRQGAFQGSAAKDAYFVRCDRSTHTDADLQLGQVNLLLGFAPHKPAEFVVLRLTLRTAPP